ncbi:unnamed protein product [Protopolystoma xenopodis]|uniref:Uncharacterized protein n=1 Tax=Protopolystoma xenopodis TaxID=117903 RepID=A0A448WJJ0_9PLAT|nr:unnamed protein product [Protopolystoma xenopodis]
MQVRVRRYRSRTGLDEAVCALVLSVHACILSVPSCAYRRVGVAGVKSHQTPIETRPVRASLRDSTDAAASATIGPHTHTYIHTHTKA